jgi:hypothetical protein
MKRCGRCRRMLPETPEFFVPNKECRNGLAGTCRNCHRAYTRDWKAINSERIAPRRRALYAARTARDKQKKEHARWERQPYKMRARVLYLGMRARAQSRAIPLDKAALDVFALTNWLMRQTDCECCRQPFQMIPKGAVWSDSSPSIDRLVPALGYVPGNVALLCWRCNNLKRNATAAELRRISDWMGSRVLARERPLNSCGDQALEHVTL